MPNLETGHYFLTMLAPVRLGTIPGVYGCSWRQQLLTVLAELPNSEITPNSRGMGGAGSPFARIASMHLGRFVLIDDEPYNGRETGDTLLGKLSGVDPLVHQPVDRLVTPYLLFGCDFDAAEGDPDPLRSFTAELWRHMQAELKAIYANCYGFEAVDSAEAFLDYVKACQVETTMPFNDYYPLEPHELVERKMLPADIALPVDGLLTGAKLLAGILGVWLVAILAAALLPASQAERFCAGIARWGLLVVPLLVAGAAAWIWVLYRRIMAQGAKSLPRSASLPEVLKALYIQQHFLDFVIDSQADAPQARLDRFRAFVATHQPTDTRGPTQAPGLIRLPEHPLPQGAPV